jgi:hypothetical protein
MIACPPLLSAINASSWIVVLCSAKAGGVHQGQECLFLQDTVAKGSAPYGMSPRLTVLIKYTPHWRLAFSLENCLEASLASFFLAK